MNIKKLCVFSNLDVAGLKPPAREKSGSTISFITKHQRWKSTLFFDLSVEIICLWNLDGSWFSIFYVFKHQNVDCASDGQLWKNTFDVFIHSRLFSAFSQQNLWLQNLCGLQFKGREQKGPWCGTKKRNCYIWSRSESRKPREIELKSFPPFTITFYDYEVSFLLRKIYLIKIG